MKRTGTIVLAVVFAALQWAGTLAAQNAAQKNDLEEKNKQLQAQVEKLKNTIAELKAQLSATQQKAKQAMEKAEEMAANAAKQKQQMLQVMQRMMAQRGGIGGAPAIIQKQLKPVKKEPVKVIRGKITKIDDEDKTLVQLDLGSKDGLKLGQKLEVVRMNPQAVFLGEIRIVELMPNSALGRHVILPGRRARSLQTGDIVTNDSKSEKSK